VLVLERREALEIFFGNVVAGGSEVCDRVVEVLGIPEHERVEREAERAELVFSPFPVRLAQLALVAVEDGPGDGVTGESIEQAVVGVSVKAPEPSVG
jgi:hypothetical protein